MKLKTDHVNKQLEAEPFNIKQIEEGPSPALALLLYRNHLPPQISVISLVNFHIVAFIATWLEKLATDWLAKSLKILF